MTTVKETDTCVESISLVDDLEKRVALATIHIGDIQLRGIAVWRSGNGQLRVHFPGYRLGSNWDDAICVPDELRSQIEADVITAYKEAKAGAKTEEKKTSRAKGLDLGRLPFKKMPF